MRPHPARMYFPPELWPTDQPRRPTTLRFQRAFPGFSRPVIFIADWWPVWSGLAIFFGAIEVKKYLLRRDRALKREKKDRETSELAEDDDQ